MNKHDLSVLGLGLVLLISSCKKNDVQHNSTPVNPQTTTQVKTTPEWKALNNWTSRKNEKFTTLTSKVTDSTLSLEVARTGLVLAFAKFGNTIKALPFQESTNGDAYWYYQVSKGVISFSVDNYTAKAANDGTFKYFIFSAAQLKDLEAKGITKLNLMQLPYQEVQALFRN